MNISKTVLSAGTISQLQECDAQQKETFLSNFSFQRKPYNSFQDIVDRLQRLCDDHRTGVLFVITEKKRLARIAFDRGEIVSVFFQGKHGTEALAHLIEIHAGKLHFEEGMTSHHATSLPATAEILLFLFLNIVPV